MKVADDNIRKIAETLGCELHIDRVPVNELRDLQLAYFKSQVPYQDTVQDHVILHLFIGMLKKWESSMF